MSADASAAAAQAATDAAAAAAKNTADASAKAAADKAATDAAAKATQDAAATKAPTEYKPFKLPEGAKLEGDTLKAFTDFAKKLNLSQEAAQEFVDRELKLQADQHAATQAEITKAATDWAAAAKADAEIGGAEHDANLGIAKKALETFGSKQLQDMLNTMPLGKHPEVVRFLFKVGKAISQDGKVVAGGAPPNGEKTAAQVFYAPMN